MLYTLALILIVAWLLGFVSSYTMDGFIHVLLVIAIVLILVRLIQGNKSDKQKPK
jgi:hypothetical protein